ncbi:hypothetical protein Taro_054809, partial [Colocasia esculenta]|nr:hypothetical protein [Colocasia esculenta]
MGLKPSLRTRLVAFDHRTLDEALSAACRQDGEMEQYFEEKKASQKRPAATFQRQDKKKAVYPTQPRSVAVGSSQVPSVRSPGTFYTFPRCEERVSPLWEDTWWFRVLDDYGKVLEVRKQRPQDQGLSETSAASRSSSSDS